jgi:hypothetical protein
VRASRLTNAVAQRAVHLHLADSLGGVPQVELERISREFLGQLCSFQYPYRIAFTTLLLLPPSVRGEGRCARFPAAGDLIRTIPLGATAINVLRSLLTVIALDGHVRRNSQASGEVV